MGRHGGHAPGANYAHAIGHASARRRLWAGARWRRRADPPPFRTNGVSIDVGRQVYWNLEGGAVICPGCGHRETCGPETTAVGTMCSTMRSTNGSLACLGCEVGVGLNDWDWGSPWSFSALGVTFWNWANLSEEFIAEVREFLGGHRLVYGANKI